MYGTGGIRGVLGSGAPSLATRGSILGHSRERDSQRPADGSGCDLGLISAGLVDFIGFVSEDDEYFISHVPVHVVKQYPRDGAIAERILGR